MNFNNKYDKRVPDELFRGDHYLGRPADFTDKIVERRVRLAKQIDEFVGKEYSLLDIGCGNGASMALFASSMATCTGIDIEDVHQDEFDVYVKDQDIKNCSFKKFDIEKGPPDIRYDRIISFEVIEHLRDERNVKFYYDALNEGGIAAISVPNKWWIFETHGARLPLLPWNRVPFFSWLPRPVHERFANARIYTKKRIRKLLEHAGFNVEKIEYVTAPLDVLKESRFKRLFIKYIFKGDTTRWPFLATSLFIVARK